MAERNPTRPLDKLGTTTFQTLLQSLVLGSDKLVLDLGAVRLITPAAMTQLAAMCYAWRQRGIRPILLINNEAVQRYLLRSQFVEAVHSVARFEPDLHQGFPSLYRHLSGTNPMLKPEDTRAPRVLVCRGPGAATPLNTVGPTRRHQLVQSHRRSGRRR